MVVILPLCLLVGGYAVSLPITLAMYLPFKPYFSILLTKVLTIVVIGMWPHVWLFKMYLTRSFGSEHNLNCFLRFQITNLCSECTKYIQQSYKIQGYTLSLTNDQHMISSLKPCLVQPPTILDLLSMWCSSIKITIKTNKKHFF